MTIKKRIVIWYTIWMAFLVIITLLVLFSGGGAIVRREAIENLEEAVNDAAEDIMVRDGRIRMDDVSFYDDGVYISIWDNGSFFEGRFPDDAPDAEFRSGVLQSPVGESGTWYYLDLEIADGIFIRGAYRSYDMGLFVSSMQILAFILLPLVVILAAFGGYIIVRRSLKPAEKVITTAGEIAGSDDLSKRIALGEGKDEIHQMASAFDSMLDRIENAFEKEQQFTSDASHELRTPIAVILAETDYAGGHTGDEEKMKEALSIISRQAEKMSGLVSELLTLARSDKGTLQLHPEIFDLGELGEMVLSTMEEKASERHIMLSAKTAPDVMIEADQGMIARVMINLISNAITYGRENGWAILRINARNDEAVIEVEDDGIGISREHIDKIWDRFFQSDSSRNSSASSGAGLGLSIVKEIVLAHGGSVGVESILGKGSVFTVKLPVKQSK